MLVWNKPLYAILLCSLHLMFGFFLPGWAQERESVSLPGGALYLQQQAQSKTAVTQDAAAKAMEHFLLGKKHHDNKLYVAAIREYQQALLSYPGWDQAKRALLWAKNDLRRLELKDSSRLTSLRALVAQAEKLYQRGSILESENNWVDAAIAYKAALKIISEFPEAQEALHRVQASVKKPVSPSAPLSTPALRAAKSGSHTQASYAVIASRADTKTQREIQEHSNHLKNNLSQNKNPHEESIQQAIQNHFLVGQQALNNQDYVSAIQKFELILEFYPDHKKTLSKLKWAKDKLEEEKNVLKNQVREAQTANNSILEMKSLRDLIRIDPTNVEVKTMWEEAKARNSKIVDELYRKSVDHYVKGDYQEALQISELILDINPDHTKAQESTTKIREKLLLIAGQQDKVSSRSRPEAR